MSWNLNHLKNRPLAHSKHVDSSSFKTFQNPILNHTWKLAYGRYGHYVDFSLMGPSGCYIVYLLNYPWRSRRLKWTKKIWNNICKKFITHFTILVWNEGIWNILVYCVMLHTTRWWLVFDNYSWRSPKILRKVVQGWNDCVKIGNLIALIYVPFPFHQCTHNELGNGLCAIIHLTLQSGEQYGRSHARLIFGCQFHLN